MASSLTILLSRTAWRSPLERPRRPATVPNSPSPMVRPSRPSSLTAAVCVVWAALCLVLPARVLTRLGQHVAAAADFTRAIAHEPDPLPEHYLERAQALAAEGEGHLDEALGGLDEGIQKLGPLVVLELLAIDLELR